MIPRIAFCSPFNPVPSGISDYSEELLTHLWQYADLVLYYNSDTPPTNPVLREHFTLRPLRRLARDHRRRPFDGVLYHLGNSPAHSEIWHTAQRVPGVIVLHDLVLHHFMLHYYATTLHNIRGYVAMMKQTYGEAGTQIAELMIRGRFTDAAFDFACNTPVITAARAMIVHSRYIQQRVAAVRPDLPLAVVPMGIPLPPDYPRAAARAAVGLPTDALILASFGHINAYKRLEPTLRAVQQLRASVPQLRYLLVGSVSPNYPITGLIERLGLQDVVHVTGYVERAAFEAYVAAADVCVNLRYPTAGETSASLLRLLGAGRATLVSRTGAFAELPPHVAVQIDTDDSEREHILAALHLLISRPELAASIGAHARAYVAQNHTLAQAAAGYARLLARCYGWPQVVRLRPPLPLPAATTLPSLGAAVPTALPPATATPAPMPPPTSVTALCILRKDRLLQTAAQALAELGLQPHDTQLVPQVAAALSDLIPIYLEEPMHDA